MVINISRTKSEYNFANLVFICIWTCHPQVKTWLEKHIIQKTKWIIKTTLRSPDYFTLSGCCFYYKDICDHICKKCAHYNFDICITMTNTVGCLIMNRYTKIGECCVCYALMSRLYTYIVAPGFVKAETPETRLWSAREKADPRKASISIFFIIRMFNVVVHWRLKH